MTTIELDEVFRHHTKTTAPAASQPQIAQTEKEFGALQNLHALFAEAPVTYQTYMTAFDQFLKQSGFSPLEAQVVFMTANFHNRCHYCMAGHTMMMKMGKMPDDVIEDLREGPHTPRPRHRQVRVGASGRTMRSRRAAPGAGLGTPAPSCNPRTHVST